MKKIIKKVTHNKKKKKIPFGINLLSLIYLLSVLLSLIIAGILFYSPEILSPIPGFDSNVPTVTIYSIAIFLIFFSALSYYIYKGLRIGDKNARMILIVLLVINIFGGLTSIFNAQNPLSWINVSLNLIALLYIFLSKKAKKHFE